MYLSRERDTGGELAGSNAVQVGMAQFELIYGFIYSRVGNVADAEDLTQQVALKALHRLREGSPELSVRAYLYATARTVLSSFWAQRYRMPESELADDVRDDRRGEALEAPPEAAAWLNRTLDALPAHYREVLELRFLRACSLREAAEEMGKSVGAIKLMQMRALRAAAAVMQPDGSKTPDRSPRARPRPAAAPGLACEPQP